jgi:hypothetical protein
LLFTIISFIFNLNFFIKLWVIYFLVMIKLNWFFGNVFKQVASELI